MKKETFEKALENYENIKWCNQIIKRKSDDHIFAINLMANDGSQTHVVKCPDWLKNNIVKMAEKFKTKLEEEFENL